MTEANIDGADGSTMYSIGDDGSLKQRRVKSTARGWTTLDKTQSGKVIEPLAARGKETVHVKGQETRVSVLEARHVEMARQVLKVADVCEDAISDREILEMLGVDSETEQRLVLAAANEILEERNRVLRQQVKVLEQKLGITAESVEQPRADHMCALSEWAGCALM